MRKHITPSLVISIIALVLASTPLADAARHAVAHVFSTPKVDGHKLSTKPYADGILLLDRDGKFPAAAIPTAANASRVDGKTIRQFEPSCPPLTVDLGTWCLDDSPYPVNTQEIGENNWFWASRKCVESGGFLPSTAELIGAARRVKLEGKIHENADNATIEEDIAVGLKDQREMSSTLVTTQGGSGAAGSEQVPEPETAQYVTVYSNEQKGGLAGGEPVAKPENFRCGYYTAPGAVEVKEE
jgi:hypothetical protein